MELGHEYEKEVYEEYKSVIKSLEERVKRLDQRIEEVAESPKYQKAIGELRAFKGIDYLIVGKRWGGTNKELTKSQKICDLSKIVVRNVVRKGLTRRPSYQNC
jgi:hypothetical protein